jgi:plastocyanin
VLAAAVTTPALVSTPAEAQGENQPIMYILMGDHYFLPASVTVRPRTTVVWINQGSDIHSVRSALWDSGPMLPGQAFWRTFNVPGEYWFTDPTYTDDGMSGYITIQTAQPISTRTPVGRRPAAAPPAPPATSVAPAQATAVGGTPAPRPQVAADPTPPTTPAALASPVPGAPMPGVTGPGGPAPAAGTPAAATTPLRTPAAPSPGPGAMLPSRSDGAVAPPTSMDPGASALPTEGDALPLPESRTPPTDDGAGWPLPLLGGGLLLLGLLSGERLRRSGR